MIDTKNGASCEGFPACPCGTHRIPRAELAADALRRHSHTEPFPYFHLRAGHPTRRPDRLMVPPLPRRRYSDTASEGAGHCLFHVLPCFRSSVERGRCLHANPLAQGLTNGGLVLPCARHTTPGTQSTTLKNNEKALYKGCREYFTTMAKRGINRQKLRVMLSDISIYYRRRGCTSEITALSHEEWGPICPLTYRERGDRVADPLLVTAQERLAAKPAARKEKCENTGQPMG